MPPLTCDRYASTLQTAPGNNALDVTKVNSSLITVVDSSQTIFNQNGSTRPIKRYVYNKYNR